ncbi:2-hydroxyacyl-CoA dehydratase [Clostridium sp. P21]|uniref:2-hydroxyacyl-CoA dehydratase n=1 Tax=Clostridium muellerianum TaxID=2716538 RepID=A0A7Y0EIY7_9CLOT|nr:double-cubane-cluster-containing anaerobic reductase [Clostridium muellerianum]NMM63235.1 2-hydroxyacyl-CoA dehydratase [Clostridium muellerianum]
MNELPEQINEFGEKRRKGFVTIKNLKDEGKKVVGVFCAFTPKEVIAAAGAIPIGICGTSEEPIQDAEKHLPRNLCPLIKSSYGFAITNKCPYTYFSDLIVGETTCDGKKKMYEMLGKIKSVHVMQLPQTTKGEDSYKLWKNEIIKLKEKVEKEFNVEITEENLKDAIKLKNIERETLKEFYELGKMMPPPILGMDILKVLRGAAFSYDKEEEIKTIRNMTKNIKEAYKKGENKVLSSAKRILVTGCPLGESTDKIINTIEQNGGVVVCFENCGGVKDIGFLVDETIDPIDALTSKYLNIACSCMTPNDNRIELLSQLIDEYKVDGVVDVILQACHTYNVETYRIKEFVTKEKNIPYLSIETDYSQTDIGQLKTRIGAFVEMI